MSLQTDLTAERQARREAEATCTSLSHDRQRLQRARDELASNLLVMLLSFLGPDQQLTLILWLDEILMPNHVVQTCFCCNTA